MFKFSGHVNSNRTMRADRVIYEYGAESTQTIAKRIKSRARQLVPVLTGTLQNAIDYEMVKAVAYVGISPSEAHHYWYLVEFGTRYADAHPYFRPAADAEKSEFVRVMRGLPGALREFM